MAVSTIPVLVNLTALDESGVFYGPYEVGSALYVVIADSGGPTEIVSVFKSTDSGTTWALQDTASTTNNGRYTPIFTSTTIHVVYARLGSPNVFGNVRFDIGSDSFLPAVETTVSHTLVAGQVAALRSDGSVFAGYAISDTGVEALYGNFFSGGVWGVESLLFQALAGENVSSMCSIVDAVDVTHFVFVHEVLSVETIKYLTIDAGGSVSGDVTIPISNISSAIHPGLSWSGGLVFTYIDNVTLTSAAAMATGASSNPATAAWMATPLWSGTLLAGSSDNTPFPLLDGTANLQVAFVNNDMSGVPSNIYMVDWNGSGFNPPVLFYDSIAYPPPGTAGNVAEFLESIVLNSGVYHMAFGANYGAGQPSTFFAFSGSTPVFSGYRNRVY